MATGSAWQRYPWLDVLRGGSILLVVIFHVHLYLVDGYARSLGVIWQLDNALSYVRMPAFFLAAGILSAKGLSLPWPELVMRRVLPLLWLLLIWSLVRHVFFGQLWTNVLVPEEGTQIGPLLLVLFAPSTGIWFLWALAIFTLLARLLGDAPRRLWLPGAVLLIAGGLSMAAWAMTLPGLNWAQNYIPRYALSFLIGVFFSRQILAGAERYAPRLALAGGIGFTLSLGVLFFGKGLPSEGLKLLIWPFHLTASLSGMSLAIGLSVLITTWPSLTKGLQYLGRRTLPIYVAHTPIVAGITAAWVAFQPEVRLWQDGVFSLMGAGLAIALSLGLWRLLLWAGLGLFYRMPGQNELRFVAENPGPESRAVGSSSR